MALGREYRNSFVHTLIVGWVAAIAVLWTSTFISPKSVAAESLTGQVTELLRTRIEAAGVPPKISAGEEIIHASIALPLFYERRMYRPAWTGDDGPLPQADALLKAIRQAEGEGLKPADYHLAKIDTTLEQVRRNQADETPLNPGRLVDLDILLSDAFLVYGSHLLVGRINPETIDAEWLANRRQADLASVLQTALESGQIEETLSSLLPPQPGYVRLKQALARYRDMAARGHWLSVPDGPKMQKGDRDQRVVALRKRLVASADLDQPSDSNTALFGDSLEVAVRNFQHRHGLDVDGIVGPATLAALNVSAEERIRQIEINMERWRWLPQNLGQCYVLVNIANFELDVVENELLVMTMRVVVGRDYRRTPVFSDKMTYLVLSPYWHVPPKLAIQDKLPLIRKNPDYLVKEKIRVFQGWGAETKEVDPQSVDWSSVTARNFNYRLRQEPGTQNALGRVKFMFPNKFDVYLHDTPSRELFAKTVRTFSSGCIRIEKPIELAEYLLAGDPKWTRATILATIEKRAEQTVRLPEPIPIHLLYWTAWADQDGSVQFRNDIYGRDKLLDEALREEPPLSF